jgi:FAD synthase
MTAMMIGVFDGVHRGHQLLIQEILNTHCHAVALTFPNHPLETLKGFSPALLTPLPWKISLLKEYGIQETIVLPFTRRLSDLSFEDFLAPYSFRHLILGEDAALGKGNLGNSDTLKILGLQRGFMVHSMPKLFAKDLPISSTRIRHLIKAGELEEAARLLGRPHTFYYAPFQKPIALPPDGRYPIWVPSPKGLIETELTIRNQIPKNPELENHWVSFGPDVNPLLYQIACPTSLAAL